MITVELDIFSGNPNPRWALTNKETKELMDRVLADPSLTLPPKSVGGLGYRGFTINVHEDSKEHLVQAGLPSKFYISAQQDPDAEKWLLDSRNSGKSVFDDVLQVAKETVESTNEAWGQLWRQDRDVNTSPPPLIEGLAPVIGDPVPNIVPGNPSRDESPEAAALACGREYVQSDTDFSFWNDPYSVTRNNCYNFAAGWRSHTYAQPGKKAGLPYSILDCGDGGLFRRTVGYGANLDGFSRVCWEMNRFYTCYVIWPGRDYHWYALCANNHWCHKPGGTPARNYDNRGNWISDPRYCDRGPYIWFCNFRHFPVGWTVK